MKKAIAAAVLLALLFGAAAWNIAHIDSLTGSLTASADEALAHCRAEDYNAAEDALREAIDELPEREKMTILLRFFKGLTQEQAARLLGVSQVQVSRLERRALEKLRASLSDGL